MPLLAGISSFGVAGTLACAILSVNHSIHFTQSTAIRRQIQENCSWGWQRILPICAKSNWLMEKLIESNLKEIETGNWPIQGICAASAHLATNHHWPFRAALIFGEENGRMEIVKKVIFLKPNGPYLGKNNN
jgi:acyl transferase domain-containing protein